MSARRLRVLVVSTQFPFPTHSGFATRVYQLARQLARRHDVTLLSYAHPAEREGVARLREEFPVEVVERDATPVAAKRLAQMLSTVSRRPFACRAIHSRAMQRAIDDVCAAGDFDVIQLESSLLCEFTFPASVPLVLDEHNVEYEVFQRMHEGERSLVRRSFNRLEFRRFRRFEQRWWRRVDGCVVTSPREELMVASHAPTTPTAVVPNGVDLACFQPNGATIEPQTLVFNGILDYRPNLDAAFHLVDDIWPLVVQRCPDARLTIVGRGHPGDMRSLSRPGVTLTGAVPDVRPYLQRAAVVGVPIRMGGGTRLKVVEGLAMGKAMVSTSLGCEGIAVNDGEHLLIADGAEAFASEVVRLFGDARRAGRLGFAGRALMENEYSWDLAGDRLDALYRCVTSRARAKGASSRATATRPAGIAAASAPRSEGPPSRSQAGLSDSTIGVRSAENPR
jgi:polysaccharide biosynthesis protein PslH